MKMQYLSVKIFGISMIATISCLFFLGRGFGFDRFAVRTAHENVKVGNAIFAPDTLIQTPIVGLALAHISVGKGQYVSQRLTKNTSVFGLLQQQRALLGVDVFALLKNGNSEDKKRALDTHLRHLLLITEQSKVSKDELYERSQRLYTESIQCLEKKRAGDQQFFVGVQQWKDPEINAGLAQSLEYAPCYITKRIESNAASYLGAYVSKTLPLLLQRTQLLTQHHDTLLQYHELMEGSLLDELRMIKAQMNTIRVPTQQDMDLVFNFTWGSVDRIGNTKLNGVFFPNDQIPTFDNPGVTLNAP